MTNRLLLIASVLTLGFCTPGTATLAATPAQYDAVLAHVQTLLTAQAGALSHAPATSRDTVPVGTTAVRELGSLHSVQAADGIPQPVDNVVLAGDIARAAKLTNSRRRADAYRQASAQIAALRTEMASSPSALNTNARRATVLAQATLRGPEFASDPLPPPSLLDRFVAWLNRIFSRLHGPSGPSPEVNPQFIKTLLVVLAAGAFAVLVWALVQYLRQRPRRSPLTLDDTEAALMEARDADSLRALAEQQAGKGQWRAAFRLTYLATLVGLDTQGVLQFDRARTNWEYLRALRAGGRGDLYHSLAPFTREFDRVWYGVARAVAGDYAYASAQYEALRASAVPNAPPVAVSV